MNIGCIGTGKIASAVIEAFCTSQLRDVSFFLSPRNEATSKRLANRFKQVSKLHSNQEVVDRSEIILIALRPADALVVLKELEFTSNQTIVSFIPLVKYAQVAEAVSPATNICRAIPLPPVVNHTCPIPLYHAPAEIVSLFNHIGQTLIVGSEDELHALWTLTGLISPFYDQLAALADWTVEHGVEPATANRYVADMFYALAQLAHSTNPVDFRALAAHAATPNGMNEQAAKEVEAKGAHQVYKTASENLLKRFK